MTTPRVMEKEPLWLATERQINEMGAGSISGAGLEGAVQTLAARLDEIGYQVSGNAGYMLDLRKAVGATAAVGRPMLQDLDQAFAGLTLETVAQPYAAMMKLTESVGSTWPRIMESDKRPHLLKIVEQVKLDLQVARAKELSGEPGIRFLIAEGVAPAVIMERLGIDQEEMDRVLAAVKAERAERARVKGLLEEVSGKADQDRIRHLINGNVADDLIMEMAEVDQEALDGVKKAMEEEVREKERLAAEAAARKAAEAAGPSLEDIPADEMLEHIEAIREILDFSDVEAEIRTMCEQSRIPKDLIEIAVSDPDKLDELEAQAEG